MPAPPAVTRPTRLAPAPTSVAATPLLPGPGYPLNPACVPGASSLHRALVLPLRAPAKPDSHNDSAQLQAPLDHAHPPLLCSTRASSSPPSHPLIPSSPPPGAPLVSDVSSATPPLFSTYYLPLRSGVRQTDAIVYADKPSSEHSAADELPPLDLCLATDRTSDCQQGGHDGTACMALSSTNSQHTVGLVGCAGLAHAQAQPSAPASASPAHGASSPLLHVFYTTQPSNIQMQPPKCLCHLSAGVDPALSDKPTTVPAATTYSGPAARFTVRVGSSESTHTMSPSFPSSIMRDDDATITKHSVFTEKSLPHHESLLCASAPSSSIYCKEPLRDRLHKPCTTEQRGRTMRSQPGPPAPRVSRKSKRANHVTSDADADDWWKIRDPVRELEALLPRDENYSQRPRVPWVRLLRLLILTAPGKRLALPDIYLTLQHHWPYFRQSDHGRSAKNSIRNVLSLNTAFRCIPRSAAGGDEGKGGFWVVQEDVKPSTVRRPHKRKYATTLDDQAVLPSCMSTCPPSTPHTAVKSARTDTTVAAPSPHACSETTQVSLVGTPFDPTHDRWYPGLTDANSSSG